MSGIIYLVNSDYTELYVLWCQVERSLRHWPTLIYCNLNCIDVLKKNTLTHQTLSHLTFCIFIIPPEDRSQAISYFLPHINTDFSS